MPQALFVIDVGHEKIAVAEAVKLGIPVVGIVDTNNSPDGIDYIIPGNDDAIRAIKLYVEGMADSILDSKPDFTDTSDASGFVELGEDGEIIELSKQKAKKKAAPNKKAPKVTTKSAKQVNTEVAAEPVNASEETASDAGSDTTAED